MILNDIVNLSCSSCSPAIATPAEHSQRFQVRKLKWLLTSVLKGSLFFKQLFRGCGLKLLGNQETRDL